MVDDLKKFWLSIDTVMLDMDGTLLDKHFDDYFWEHYVPEMFAEKHKIDVQESREKLLGRYQKLEGTLEWTDLDFWSAELGLDIPGLKNQVNHLIAVHPYVVQFLEFCKESAKFTCLVTNAHTKTLEIKMAKTALQDHFDQIVCSQDVGTAKEDIQFWQKLQKYINFDPERTLLADDTEAVLISAKNFGISNLVHIAKPSSKAPQKASSLFKSIKYFKELIP